jgi:hypothetical protein
LASEKVTLYRTNEDQTEVIEQLPKTVASQVYDSENEQFLDETLTAINAHTKDESEKKHIEVVSSVPTNLSESGILFKVDGTQADVPSMITVDALSQQVSDLDRNLAKIAHVDSGDLATAIANTPDGGRLVLNNGAVYNISSSIIVNKSIVIDGNNATITTNNSNNAKIHLRGTNAEIYNTIFERVPITIGTTLGNTVKGIKIINNKFKNTYDNAIESYAHLESLIVRDNELNGTIVATGQSKNFNNSGSFVYLNGGKVNFLSIQRNHVLNVGGGTNVFMSGEYPSLDISDNIFDTMAQRGIGFWYASAKGVIARNNIYKCGVLKAPGLGPGGEGAGIGCNAIYGINSNVRNVDVVDNYIEFVYENGIEGNYKSIKRNTIIGTGMDLVNYPTPSYEGIFISGGNIDIEDNIIINPKGSGIYCYTSGAVLVSNVSIRRNKIVCDTLNDAPSHAGIRFATPDTQTYSNIYIEDNRIENFANVIILPASKTYSNIKLGKQFTINYTRMINALTGVGVDIKSLSTNKLDLIKNGNFNLWNTETNRPTDWTISNASIELVTDQIKNSIKITATDAFNGRLIQSTIGVAFPQKTSNRHVQLVIRAKGNNDLLIRNYTLNASGTAVGSPISPFVTGLSETEFKTFKIMMPYEPSFRLELCNRSGVGSWIEISEVNAYLIDCED